jgi:hypothetical protein
MLKWDKPVDIAAVRLCFDSNLNNDKRMPCSYPQKGDRSAVPDMLVRGYRLDTQADNGEWRTVFHDTNNYQRLAVAAINCRARALRFTPETTWGAETARLFGFDALAEDPKRLPAPPTRVRWADVVAAVDPADLAPPESGLEDAEKTKSHGA